MAKAELGTKRTCGNCAARFYDLGRDPIICPKCSTTFIPAPVSRAKPEKAAPVKPKPAEDEEELEGAELVTLEDADDEDGTTGAVKAASLDDDDEDNDDIDIDLELADEELSKQVDIVDDEDVDDPDDIIEDDDDEDDD